jgi:hypothetical protein
MARVCTVRRDRSPVGVRRCHSANLRGPGRSDRPQYLAAGNAFLTLPLRFTLVLTKEKGYWQRLVFQAGFEELPQYILLTFVVAAAVTVLGTWLFVRIRSILLHRWGRARGD